SKPSKPFNVDDVLKFTFTGEKHHHHHH
nr:Chain I, RNA polymerase II mediator complex subunit 8 [Saccharomyces cerevisiae]2HZS_J Chain J, RNA polymerase II mediator complex subunit 8 [Saccharomyces cerevisiae]2HZS_K Chain K, RNA polymerase II mediator complex subunit 8 [Saccharomyces cerevisiae]2HZS_L Chain L, RNA polymerase II mediator complex subunit 8 [Saccharomyces cerevisiae]